MRYRAAEFAQRGAIFRQIHAVGHDAVEQGFRRRRQLADGIAGGLQGVQHVEQRVGNVEVVGADVMPAGRVVVVDDGQALVGVGLAAQGLPAGAARGETVDFGGEHDRRPGLDAGQAVGLRLAQRGDDDGLADALQFGQRNAVLHRVGRQTIRRQAPLRCRALSQTNRLEDRHIEFPEGFGHCFAPFGGADDEILQHDQRCRLGRGDQFR